MKTDRIKSADDLRKLLDEAGLPHVPIYEVPHLNEKLPKMSDAEKRKIQLDAIRQARDGRGKS